MQPSLQQRMAIVLCSCIALILVLELCVLRFRDLYIDVGEGSSVPFLENFRESERAAPAEGGFSFQWSRDVSVIRLPEVYSTAPWLVTLRLHQRSLDFPEVVIFQGAGFRIPVRPPPGTRSYHVLLPRTGPLTIESAMSTVVHENLQTRGVAVDYVRNTRVGGGFSINGQVVLFALLSMSLAGALLALARIPLRDTILATIMVAAIVAIMLGCYPAYAFIALASTNTLLGIMLPATIIAYILLQSPAYHSWRAVVSAIQLSIVLKMVGVFYPGFLPTDSIFHVHRLEGTILGEMFRISAGQAQEFPYPTSAYQLIAPFALIYSDLRWLIQAASVILDSTTIALLAITLRGSEGGRKAAGWSGLLYAIMPAGFLFQWHNAFAQTVGQWFGVCYVTAFVYAIRHDRRTVRFYLLLVLLSFLAATGHFGAYLNLFATIVVMIVVFPSFSLRHRYFISTWFVGAMVSFLLYYSAFLGLFVRQSRNLTRSSPLPASAHFFWLRRFVWELGIEGHYLTIYVILAVSTVLVLFIRHRADHQTYFPIYASMILVSMVLAVLQVTIFLNTTRYIIFAYPAIILFSALAVIAIEKYQYSWLATRLLVYYTVASSVLTWALGFALHEQIG